MKLAVALIHGIGDQPDSRDEDGLHSYARELVAALRRRLGAEAGEVAFQSLYWASVLDARELDYLKRIEREPLGWRWLRRAVTLFLGDASGYRKVSAAYDTTYQQVHQHVRSGIMALRAKVGPQTPLVILAHSLGGHIVSISSGTSRNSTARRVARSTPSSAWKPWPGWSPSVATSRCSPSPTRRSARSAFPATACPRPSASRHAG